MDWIHQLATIWPLSKYSLMIIKKEDYVVGVIAFKRKYLILTASCHLLLYYYIILLLCCEVPESIRFE